MAGDGIQIVIPMSGFGERFRRAGYTVPKPLIEVDGLPIIAHVINMFPGETDLLFVCNRDHLADPAFDMEGILRQYCPTGRIVGIAPHKLGPVHAVAQVFDEIDPDRPAVVNYCDFTCYWDWDAFRRAVADTACDGAIPAYRGFHPHSLGSTFYAYVRETGGWASDIREKQPFTETPMNEYASSGTYYFASGALMRRYFERTVEEDLRTGDEFYVSLVYKPMLADGRRIAVYPLQHFMQWGTPEDLAEYRHWSDVFRRLARPDETPPPYHDGTVLVPMAGAGARFAERGYEAPKPLIPVSGRPMVVQATRDLPRAPLTRFVLRRDLPRLAEIENALAGAFPDGEIAMLDGLTDGQARTCVHGAEGLDPNAPLTIGACDNGMIYDRAALAALLGDGGPDLIVWAVRGHPGAVRRPEMYGWIDADGDRVRGVSVKTPLADPAHDPVIVGSFTFRRMGRFLDASGRLFARDGRINGEFYVDSLVEDALAVGLDCRLFEIDRYLCWGTPDELATFEYWQSCFHKWPYHPYRLESDAMVPADAHPALAQRYAAREPGIPAKVTS